jgi:hypothetical protein
MLETYKAKVRGNQIIWDDQAPVETKGGEEVEVEVTVLPRSSNGMAKRPIGLANGEFVVPDDFGAPLPDDVLAEFEN